MTRPARFCCGTCVASVIAHVVEHVSRHVASLTALKVHMYFKFLLENTTSTVKMFSLL